MTILLANNAKSTLAVALGGIDTTLVVATGTGSLFPSPTGGDYFYATIEDSTKTVREIVKCTARSGTTLTIVRAQDDSTANIFAVGSTVEMRVNKGALADSVTLASSSATAAAASASSASTSASTASTAASTATTQASNASTSATNAAASASAANTSAIAAAAAAASGLYSSVQDKSANYTVVAGDAGDLIRVTTTSGAVTITLPTISTVGDGFKIAIVKWTSDGNVVTVNRAGSDTINGATSVQIGSQYSQVILVADLETSTWFASQSGLGATNVNVDVFSGNGSTTAFTLAADPSTKNNTYVSISGVYQAKSTYSVSGTTLTFSTAPPSGTSNIEVVYGTPLAIGTPSDGTVTAAKMAAGAAVGNIGYTPANDSAVLHLAGAETATGAKRGAVTALTDGVTITPDFAVTNNYSLTIGGNRTLANPSNLVAGQSGVIVITQDGTGSRTLAYGSYWKFSNGTAPTLTTTASAVDVLAYYVESSTRITAKLITDVK